MENPKNQLATKLKEASNVLVTVSTNPSVDQLSAAIGLTLFLTKLKKHATTVFSGHVPSTIDFLKPEETIETNTDSLRDFIISLDKGKADKIRYKVEDTMVKIFITPYRTSIGDQDLVFSQGDFNVDVVIGLGIHNKEDLDQAITAHGRILHDATVATVNTKDGSDIGTLNWVEPQASSLCEMAVTLTDLMKTNSLDGQMATALLTGIVAETERFSNDKTTSTTMNASAKLMAAGANQQLVATKLEPPEEQLPPPEEPKGPEGQDNGDAETPKDATVDEDGSLRIDHESTIPETGDDVASPPDGSQSAAPPSDTLPEPWTPEPEAPPAPVAQVQIDDQGQFQTEEPQIKQDHRPILKAPPQFSQDEGMFGMAPSDDKPAADNEPSNTKLVTAPPQFGGQLSAAADDSSTETSPLNLPQVPTPLLSHDSGAADKGKEPEPDSPPNEFTPPPPMPPNLPKAAEPETPELPAPVPPQPQVEKPAVTTPEQPQGFMTMGDKTLDDIERKLDSPHVEKKTKLPEPFVKSLDGSTLAGLEERIGSTHLKEQPTTDVPAAEPEPDYHQVAAEHVAKAMSDKTLHDLEQKVGSHHLDEKPEEPTDEPPVVLEAAKPAEDDGPKLSYEPHESEPPESVASADDEENEQSADDTPVPTTDEPADEPAKDSDSDDSADDATKTDDDTPVTEDSSAEDKDTDESKADAPDDKEESAPEATPAADEARDAVMEAISAGGDGRTSLPALDGIGTSGLVGVDHEDEPSTEAEAPTPPATPPPLPIAHEPTHQEPSPNIHIDDKGNLSFPQNLVPNSNELPVDATAATGDATAPPPVPPPMMPTLPVPSENSATK